MLEIFVAIVVALSLVALVKKAASVLRRALGRAALGQEERAQALREARDGVLAAAAVDDVDALALEAAAMSRDEQITLGETLVTLELAAPHYRLELQRLDVERARALAEAQVLRSEAEGSVVSVIVAWFRWRGRRVPEAPPVAVLPSPVERGDGRIRTRALVALLELRVPQGSVLRTESQIVVATHRHHVTFMLVLGRWVARVEGQRRTRMFRSLSEASALLAELWPDEIDDTPLNEDERRRLAAVLTRIGCDPETVLGEREGDDD